ncbi:hypothetical protein T4A_13545 [Trichinella pseudospiralis]|uniref:Uncharacterized protein n=1 Tax=Trichinella pseudospiralis TaxID=6337 RepID=A0A0V1DQQ4_TRIPS|nr:hypothetical protein T4A_13545 [Trichinella pseudospiralis]
MSDELSENIQLHDGERPVNFLRKVTAVAAQHVIEVD